MVDSLNIPNPFVTVVSGAPQMDTLQMIRIKHGSSGTPENTDLVRRYRYHNSTGTIYNENALLRQILTREYTAPRNLTKSTIKLARLLSSHIGLSNSGYDSVYQMSVFH